MGLVFLMLKELVDFLQHISDKWILRRQKGDERADMSQGSYAGEFIYKATVSE